MSQATENVHIIMYILIFRILSRGSQLSMQVIRYRDFPENTMDPHNPSHKSAWHQQLAQVRKDFFERGISIADWSREHGFRPNAVYRVLSGGSLAMRGNAHAIAVALGVKGGQAKPGLTSPNDKQEEVHM